MAVPVAIFIAWAFIQPLVIAIPTVGIAIWRAAAPEVLFSAPTDQRVVALTIDDAPAEGTAEILDVLQRANARATFFLIADHVRAHPDLASRIVDDGHEVANHMVADERSADLPAAEFESDLLETDALLRELTGARPRFFRPGGGKYHEEMLATVQQHGYRLVLGSVYPFDPQIPSATFASWFVRKAVHPGAIIILHDGPGRSARTARALHGILPALREQGYRVVTVSELLETAASDPD